MGEYNENGRRMELVRGVIIEKMPKSPLHCATLRRLYELARAAAGSDQMVRNQSPLTLTDSEPEPDVAVVTGTEETYRFEHPHTALLAVEISVTTLAKDREKADLYAEANVPEYWIILPERGLVEVYTEPRQGLYSVRRILSAVNGDTLTSTTLPELRLDLREFFAP